METGGSGHRGLELRVPVSSMGSLFALGEELKLMSRPGSQKGLCYCQPLRLSYITPPAVCCLPHSTESFAYAVIYDHMTKVWLYPQSQVMPGTQRHEQMKKKKSHSGQEFNPPSGKHCFLFSFP